MTGTNDAIAIADGNVDLNDLRNEDRIHLQLYKKDKLAGIKELDDCDIYLGIDGVGPIDGATAIYSIPRLSFITLYNHAMGLNGSGKYLTAVEMEFGIYNDKIILVFRPLKLHSGVSVSSNNKYYSYERKYGSYYKYTNEGFVTIEKTERDVYVNEYLYRIRILHSDISSDTHCEHVKDYDVESMVFTFQEIFNVMYDNRLKGNTTGDIFTGLADKLFNIYNCVRRDELFPVLLIKHGLLLSTYLEDDRKSLLGPFYKVYGNLAHLCPPHCNKLVYHMD